VRTPALCALPACLLITAAACAQGSEPADPVSPDTATAPAASDRERLDRLFADVAAARFDLKYREAELIIDCLEEDGFDVHNTEDLTQGWGHSIMLPSAALAAVDDPAALPTTDEAATHALGVWLHFADAYGDQEGIELNEAERETESEQGTQENTDAAVGDTAALDVLGEGWDQLPAVDQMRWEIAYRGFEWATTSKAASVLSEDEWEMIGYPGGEWTLVSAMDSSPKGCQSEVLTGLYGEPRQVTNGLTEPQWAWGPVLATQSEAFEPIDLSGIPEADRLLECLAGAGYDEWGIVDGGIDFGGHWRKQYYPEATVEHEDGTHEFNYSDITDADRERYATVEAEEFAAAAAVADCDAVSGYTDAAAVAYRDHLTAGLLESEPVYETYLADLESALESIGS
jgi:hypothetical protein